jgi:membrane protein
MRTPPARAPDASFGAILIRLGRGMYEHGALDSARLMAFNFFLSVVPLLVLMGFVLGRVVRRRGVEAVVGPLLETIPDASADLVRHELERLAGSSAASIAPLGVVTFLWLTSSGVHQMMDVFEVAAQAPRRPWWKQRVIALVTVALSLGSFSLAAWALVQGDDVVHRDETGDASPEAGVKPTPAHGGSAAQRPHDVHPQGRKKKRQMLNRLHEPWERVVAGTTVLLVGLGGLALFYRLAVEHRTNVRRRALPGALAAMGAWLAVSWVFGTYIGSLGTYAVYYGSLAAVAVLLVWLYLTSLALLFGAEVNAMLEGVGAYDPAT